ncbi:MAG: metal-dependent hydrolase [Akkermansiaceae bacterium]|nr:metal-dependent hydrolase [Akkermansiaceae bacterium]
MHYIEPHAHMVSRTTDDYQKMAQAGCRAICEPAFWAGFDRGSVEGFRDYYRQLTEYEPARAAKFGIPHFTWLCINPKEAEDVGFGHEVVSIIPEFLDKPTVLGIGEIGLNKNTRNEQVILEEQIGLALEHDLPILVHTPHLEDKLKGTRLIVDAMKNAQVNPDRVIIDHIEEHTARIVLDAGFWAGMTLYPESKCTPARAIDILETFGMERIWMNSACDWGISDPLAVVKCALEMKKRHHAEAVVQKVIFDNPKTFLSQSPNFQL